MELVPPCPLPLSRVCRQKHDNAAATASQETQCVSIRKTNAVYGIYRCLLYTKYVDTLCGKNEEILNVKVGGNYSNHCHRKV